MAIDWKRNWAGMGNCCRFQFKPNLKFLQLWNSMQLRIQTKILRKKLKKKTFQSKLAKCEFQTKFAKEDNKEHRCIFSSKNSTLRHFNQGIKTWMTFFLSIARRRGWWQSSNEGYNKQAWVAKEKHSAKVPPVSDKSWYTTETFILRPRFYIYHKGKRVPAFKGLFLV